MASEVARIFSKNLRHSSKQIFRVSVFLVALLPLITLGASSWPANAMISARLGGICTSELQWTSPPSANKNPAVPLICLRTAKGLRWQDPGKVKIDAHFNSILTKCGDQIRQIEVEKLTPDFSPRSNSPLLITSPRNCTCELSESRRARDSSISM